MTRATCSLLIFTAARASRAKRATASGLLERLGQEELERDLLVELHVMRGDDDPHPADAEHALDAVLAVDDLAFADAARQGFYRHDHSSPAGKVASGLQVCIG